MSEAHKLIAARIEAAREEQERWQQLLDSLPATLPPEADALLCKMLRMLEWK